MSDDSRAIVPVGQRGVVASVSRQIAITEKVLGRIQTAQNLLDVLNIPQNSSFENVVFAIDKETTAIAKEASNPDKLGLVSVFDDKLYEQFKPHLEKMWAEARAAFQDAMEALDFFCNKVLDSMGEDFTPYIKKFYREIKAGERLKDK